MIDLVWGGTKRGNIELKLKKKKMIADNLRRKFSIMYYKLKIRVSPAIQKKRKKKKEKKKRRQIENVLHC